MPNGRASHVSSHSGVDERDPMRLVRLWLWVVAGMIFLMVIVGGATRLTESGLSITEWKPVTGVIPPLNAVEWSEAFEKYKQIPQYKTMFPDMDLAQFQVIYGFEWTHRLLGRLIGFVFLLPFLIFAFQRRLTSGLLWQLGGVFFLGGLQGFVGWWMVSSGLTHRVEVAQERLAIHLLLACFTMALIIWIAVGLKPGNRDWLGTATHRLRLQADLLIGLIFLQIGLGGLVAGLRAGLVYNTWPLMDGRFIPPMTHLFSQSPWFVNLVDNITTVQFQHRMTAYIILAVALLHCWRIARCPLGRRAIRRAIVLVGVLLLQAALGIALLVYSVPFWIALAHQAVAVGALAMATAHRRRMGV